MRRALQVGLFIVAGFVGCDRFDRMTGCYATAADKPAEILIWRAGEVYNAVRRENGVWTDSTELRPANTSEIAQLFGADSTAIAEGLVARAGLFGLFRAKEEIRVGQQLAMRYVVWFLFMTSGAVKVSCE